MILTATKAGRAPAGPPAGSAKSFMVTGLSCAKTYYFALKTSEDVADTSAISKAS